MTKPEKDVDNDKTYDREARLKELLEQDKKPAPFADPFMGF